MDHSNINRDHGSLKHLSEIMDRSNLKKIMDRSNINRDHGSLTNLTEIMDHSKIKLRSWIVQRLTENMDRSNI